MDNDGHLKLLYDKVTLKTRFRTVFLRLGYVSQRTIQK